MTVLAMTEAAKPWYVLARSVDYVGATVFLGGAAFLALLWPAGAGDRRSRRLLTAGWLLGLAGTLAGLVFDAAWVAGTGPALDWAIIRPVLDVTFGRVWVARALLWVLAGVVLVDLLRRGERAARSAAWRAGAGAVGLGIVRTSGMTGHVNDLPGWTQVVVLVHLVAVCLWLGGLAVLMFALLPGRDRQALTEVLPRFSRLAMVSVATLTVAGALLGWRLIGSVDVLTSSGYGRILLIKLAIFAALLAAGMASKRWVDRRLVTSDGVRPLVYSVAAETVLAVFVLGAAGFLVTASPGR